MEKLNENGKLACTMAATLAAGVMSNVTYNSQAIKPYDFMEMAAEMIGCAMTFQELREPE